jgi:hypothetical protein
MNSFGTFTNLDFELKLCFTFFLCRSRKKNKENVLFQLYNHC